MSEQITLQKLINEGADLTEEQKESLYILVAKGCRQTTKTRLARKIFNISLACWENFGIYGRVHVEKDGRFSYCAGQSYPDEIRTLRDCILGKV